MKPVIAIGQRFLLMPGTKKTLRLPVLADELRQRVIAPALPAETRGSP